MRRKSNEVCKIAGTSINRPVNLSFCWSRPVASATAPVAVLAATKSAPLNLNLSSNQASISAATLALAKSLSITVGGVSQAISSASMLTAAEYVAAYEVSSVGRKAYR